MKALIVVDMTKDNVSGFIKEQIVKIVPNINRLTNFFRKNNDLVIFANDSFLEQDFLFKSKMSPHSLRYTEGSEVTEKLVVDKNDIILPKRRFSAFFKTDLDQTLRTLNVEEVSVCGITSIYCVLATALDAVCHDFYSIIVEDATTAHKDIIHEQVMNFYRNGPLIPLFKIMKTDDLITI